MDALEPDAFFGDLRLPVRQLSALQSPLEYVRGGFVRASRCLAQEVTYIHTSTWALLWHLRKVRKCDFLQVSVTDGHF